MSWSRDELKVCLRTRPHLAVHATELALLHDEVTGGLQEVGAEVTLLNVLVLLPAVPGPGAGSESEAEDGDEEFNVHSSATSYLTRLGFWVSLSPHLY